MLRNSQVLSTLRLSALAGLVATASLTLVFLSGCVNPPKSVSVSPATATVDPNDSTSLSATVTNDSNSKGVTWTTSIGTLSSQTSTSATFTAPAATAAAQSATVTATSVADPSKSASATITIPAAVSVTTAALPGDGVGTAYSQALAASGGIPPYTWSIAGGTLPSCLTINSAGVISGTPTASCVGTATNLTFKATDSGIATPLTGTSVALSINIAPAPAFVLPPGGSLLGAIIGQAYTINLAASAGGAGALSYNISAGALPGGLTLSPQLGTVTGTPTAAGTFTFTLTVSDAFGDSQSQSYSIKVAYPPVTITPAGGALPTAFTGSAYSQMLTAGGGSGAGFVWTVTGLPAAGISYSANGGTLVISGTPTSPANISFTASVKDGAGDTSGPLTYTIPVFNPISLPATNPASLPANTTVNVPYTGTITASGGSGAGYAWTVTGLSDGLTSSNNGGTLTISGTPTAAATVTFAVSVKDSSGSSTGPITYTIAVNSVLTLPATNPATLPGNALTGTPYTGTIVASGGTGSGYVFTVTSLPTDGISFSASGGTLTISGTPTTAATVTFTVSLKDSAGNTAGPLAYTINVYNPLTLPANPNSLGSANVTVPYTGTVTLTGGSGSGYTWTVTGLSDGLSYATSGATLTVSGTPTSVGTVTFTASVTDSVNNSAGPITYTIPVYNALSLPATIPGTLPADAPTGSPYTGTIVAQGGSGSGYVFTVTGLADGLTSATAGNTLTISGTPTSPQVVTLNVSVKDSANNSAGPIAYTITLYAPLVLPAANPNTLTSAIINQAYQGSINGSGGVLPYTWTLNGSVVPNTGSAVPLAGGQGLTVSAGNTSTLSFAGTPTALASVPFTLQVKDSLGNTAGPFTYNIQINPAAAAVAGTVRLLNNCGGVSALPTYTITINTNPVQQTTTDSNGNYSFASVPDGTYTVTPSIAGPTALFFPASQTNVTVSGSPIAGLNFQASLGYTVSGNVSYAGANTGQVYLNLSNTVCSGGQFHGTSIPSSSLGSGGAFTIRGVPPGLYNLTASMDPLGYGASNISDPTGIVPGLNITSANLSGVAITIADPQLAAPPIAPGFKAVSPTDHGVVITFQPIIDNTGDEGVTSYQVQWSTDSTFNTGVNSATFNAVGIGTDVWIINNSVAGISGGFANGTAYYFRARGQLAVGNGPWAVWGGGSPSAVTIGPPSVGNTITGSVTIPNGIHPTGPLYAGFYNQITGAVYAVSIQNPVVGANAYSVQVPTSADPYFNFGVVDQNNDGLIDTGDVTNTQNATNQANGINITSNLSNQNITLPTANSTATVQTQLQSITYIGGSDSFYQLNFNLRATNKLPIAVRLISGPNVISPIDIGNCLSCGHVQFPTLARLGYNGPGTLPPNVGDTYAFAVAYSDGSNETVNGIVTGWAGGSTVVAASNLATNLAPLASSSNSTTPTFTWTYPPNAADFTYKFTITDDNGNTYWTIPGNNSNLIGFPSTVSQIVWGTDPTGDTTNTPSIPSLVTGTFYPWQITVQDAAGNSALTAVYYIP